MQAMLAFDDNLQAVDPAPSAENLMLGGFEFPGSLDSDANKMYLRACAAFEAAVQERHQAAGILIQ